MSEKVKARMGGTKLEESNAGVWRGAWPLSPPGSLPAEQWGLFPSLKHESFSRGCWDFTLERLSPAHSAVTLWYPSAFGGDSPEVAPTFPRHVSLNLSTLLAENSWRWECFILESSLRWCAAPTLEFRSIHLHQAAKQSINQVMLICRSTSLQNRIE